MGRSHPLQKEEHSNEKRRYQQELVASTLVHPSGACVVLTVADLGQELGDFVLQKDGGKQTRGKTLSDFFRSTGCGGRACGV
jgi:hypothetical protein